MILLLGGTSDTAPMAEALAQAGYRVLVSKATEIPLAIGSHPAIEARSGPLDDDALRRLIREHAIRGIVDAAHPYALAIHVRAARVAEGAGIPYLALLRPSSVDAADPSIELVADHARAAQAAFADGRPVLVTTGSRHLPPYVQESQRTGVPCIVRVLDDPTSREACRAAGLVKGQVLLGRGPYDVETNRRQIRVFRVGVLVTKDSGPAGGTAEKLAAARAEGCRIIVLGRPPLTGCDRFETPEEILEALATRLRASAT